MKDYQKHIKSSIKSELAKENVAICGESIPQFDWFFQDIEHAVANNINEGRLLPCPHCVSVIINALKS